MHEDFWRARWNRNEIGFHLPQVNPWLRRHWRAEPGARVLVPLCGKSLDLAWLAGQRQEVLGIELVDSAIQAFFAERGLAPEVDGQGPFRRYRHGALELWSGDFFALRAEDVADCRLFYDRAALIALPEAMRERYVAHLSAILPARCKGLLICVDYDQSLREGPPFAVSADEVRQRWEAAGWTVERLEARDVLSENPKFLQRGITRLEEAAYRLAR